MESALWRIAKDLRAKIDTDQFRDYVLGSIFYGSLSERLERYANRVPMFPRGALAKSVSREPRINPA